MKLTRKAVQHEKVEQAHIVQLAKVLGCDVWVMGTRRAKGKACPKCGTFVAEHQGTRQTAGHPDLVLFVPRKATGVGGPECLKRLLYWETKRDGGGRLSDDQREFARCASAAGISHGIGDFDDFIAWCVQAGLCRENQFPHYRTKGISDARA